MNLFILSWNYIRSRPLNTFLNVLLLSLGMGIIIILLLLSTQLKNKITDNADGIDLVVGAKGSPMQLILSSVFHVDYPTGNITIEEAQTIIRNRYVENAIPMSMGDSYRTYRIIGTNHDYPTLYEAGLEVGEFWNAPMEATIGYNVAEKLNLEVGDEFNSQHGMAAGGHAHEEHHIQVVGIMKRNNTVLDNLILTGLETVWETHNYQKEAAPVNETDSPHEHEHEEEHKHKEQHDDPTEDVSNTGLTKAIVYQPEATSNNQVKEVMLDEKNFDKEITSLLLQYRSPMATIQLPRYVNGKTSMQAASPVFETARLFSLMGVGIKAIQALAYLIIFIAALSIFIALYNEMKKRKYDLAVMRSLGASKMKLFVHVLLEGALVTAMGGILSLLIGHGTLELLRVLLPKSEVAGITGMVFLKQEYYVLIASVVVGMIAAIIPAIHAYRTDISKVLAKG